MDGHVTLKSLERATLFLLPTDFLLKIEWIVQYIHYCVTARSQLWVQSPAATGLFVLSQYKWVKQRSLFTPNYGYFICICIHLAMLSRSTINRKLLPLLCLNNDTPFRDPKEFPIDSCQINGKHDPRFNWHSLILLSK